VVPARHCYHKSLTPLMEEVREQMSSGPVYISFDIDALDPSFAPGTGVCNWHCTYSMQGLCNGMVSVRLSIRLSNLPTTAACGRFAAVGLVGRRYQLIAAQPAWGRSMACSSKCRLCHIYRLCRKLNTDLLFCSVL